MEHMRKYFNLLNDIWKMIKASHPEATGKDTDWAEVTRLGSEVVSQNPECKRFAEKMVGAYLEYLDEL